MRPLAALGLLAVLALPAVTARAGGPAPLGKLEQQALEDALALRGLVVDPVPEGKTIGQIHVVNLDVFSPRDSYFQLLNYFHRTTREHLIAREAIFRPGQPFRQEVVDETIRYLQDPDLSSAVVIVPVVTLAPGTVDVLIVTRDVWSLRLNTNFEIQQGRILALSASLSENNLFGWRKQVALVFNMGQGSFAIGPAYVDRNIAGTRLTLSASAYAIFRRDGGEPEGSSSRTSISYPLFSLASKWGAGLTVSHSNAVARDFFENDLRRVDIASTEAKESLPWIYRVRQVNTSAGVTRSFPGRVIQRVSFGHELSVVRPSFTSDFPDDPVARAQFAKAIFPVSERVSDLYLTYGVFTPRYVTYRDLNTFDLREDMRLGPSASASVEAAARALGSERDFFSVGASAAWGWDWLGGLQSVSAGWGSRIVGGQVVDQSYSASGYFASPVLGRVVRIIGQAGASVLVDDTRNRFHRLGGDSGLRGYLVGNFLGKTWALGHLEVRSMALTVASFRLGGLAFVDVGDAASPDQGGGPGLVRAVRALSRLSPKSDAGIGLRLLIPQLNAYVLRLDWAFPLQSTRSTAAGWPGRFSLGFSQAF